MTALAIIRRLQDLKDVDPNGLPNDGVPQYDTNVSSFVVVVPATAGAFSMGVTDSGNTLGDTGVTGPRIGLVGTGNLTLSQVTDVNGGTIIISGGTAGAGGVAVSASDSLFTSGTVVLTGAGGGATVNTVAPGTVQISVAAPVAQTVQTQNLFDLTAAGNTSGVLALVSSGTLTLAGGNSITLSQNGNAITISGASTSQSVQTQAIQTGISSIVASNATYTSGSVQFTGSGIITIRSSANQRVVVDASQSVQTQNAVDVTISGNTAGVGALVSSGTLSLAGGSNITLSQNGNAISIIGNAAGTETQIAISGLAASNTTYTSGTVTITGVGGGITVSSNTGQRIDLSVAAQTVQPGIQNLVASNTTFSSGTVSISGFGAATVNTAANIIRISVPVQTAESQSIGMSNLGNTSGTTGIASGAQVQMLFAGGNNITLSQSVNGASGTITISAASQTVQTQNAVDVSLSGNTSGALALVSSGTMTLAGGNNITLSQAGNAITISGANAAGAQTAISGLANSQTTYTSGTVSLSELGAITIRSTTGNQFQFSVNAQSVQPETQTFVAGLAASNTTYTSGTISITGVGGGITVSSNTGQRIDLSVAAPVNFSAGVSNLGNTGGDTGATGTRMVLVGSNNITLSQTTGAAGATVSFFGPTPGSSDTDVTAITQAGHGLAVGDWVRLNGTAYVKAQADTETNAEVVGIVSAVADTDNFTLTTGGLVTGLSGLTAGTVYYLDPATAGAITTTEPTAEGEISKPVFIARSTTSGYVFNMRGVIVPPGEITAFLAGISNVGNTAGNTGITGSRLVLAGGNNITLSGSSNASGGTVTISAPTQTVQPGIQNLVASDATFSSGTVTISGFGDVTVNTAANLIRISGPVQTVESQSFGMSNIGNTSGTTGIASGGQVRFLLAGGNNVTLSQSLNGASGTITISAFSQTVQTQNLHNVTISGNTSGALAAISSGTMTLAGGNNITLSQAGNAVTISGPNTAAQTAESQSIGISNIGNTSGTTGIASGAQVRMLFAGGNNVTLSQSLNGASGTITVSAAAQTGTQFSAGLSNIGNTAGDTVTVGGRLILAGSNGITLSGSSNGVSQTITISGITQSVESQSIGMSNIGNTSGTTGVASGGQVRFLFAGGNNITLSQSLNGASGTITISAPNLGAGAMSAGVSNLGNSAGATGITGTQLVFVGSDNITLSQTTGANGGTVSIIGGAGGGFSAGVSTGGNTAGATGVSGTRMVLVGTNAISLSQTTGAAGNTVSIDAPATSSLVGTNGISISTNGSTISISYQDSVADWENFPRAQASLMTHVSAWSKTPIYWNDQIDGGVRVNSLAFAISMVTASQPLSLSVHLGVYTFVNSTSVARLGSVSEAYVVSSASSVSLSGVRNIVMTGIGTHGTLSSITGGEYLIGMMFSATATNAMNFSLLGASGGAGPLGAIHPGTNALSTGTSQGVQAMAGRGSTTVNAMPANVVASELINQGQGASMQLHPWLYLRS